MCTVGLYVSLCLMIFLCPFLHCKALRTAMYERYINSIIIIIIIIIMLLFVKKNVVFESVAVVGDALTFLCSSGLTYDVISRS